MSAEPGFTVVVQFTTTPANHARALELIDDYVGGFLSRQPGFIRSWLCESQEGSGLLHFALWQEEAHFRAFAQKAQDHPLLPEIRAFSPSAAFYTPARHYKP